MVSQIDDVFERGEKLLQNNDIRLFRATLIEEVQKNLPVEVLIAWLTVSLPVKTALDMARIYMYNETRNILIQRGLDADSILKGLE